MRTEQQLKEDALEVSRATMTAKLAAKYIGLSYWKTLELVKASQIPHIRISGPTGRVLFRKESLDEWLRPLSRRAGGITRFMGT